MLNLDTKHMSTAKLSILFLPAIVFSFAYLALAFFNKPVVTSYSQLIAFTFSGVENGYYPNGDKFRLEDVISSGVVRAAVQKLELTEKYGSLDGIENDFSIYPYFSQRQAVIAKYEGQLEDKNTSIVDIDEARNSLMEELDKSNKVTAKLRFYDAQSALSPYDVKNLLETVVAVWADQSTFSRGVSNKSFNVLSPYVLKSRAPDNTLRSLRDTWSEYEMLSNQVAALRSSSKSAGAIDKETGVSIEDLQSLLKDLEHQLVYAPIFWSTQPENMLKLDQSLFSPELFDADLLSDMDYLIMIDVASDRVKLAKQNISDLIRSPFGETVTDYETGMTLDDLDRLLDDILVYDIGQLRVPLLQLGISKDVKKVPLYYQMRVRELENDKKALLAKVDAIQGAESRYMRSTAEQSSAAGEGALGTQFLNKIVAMGAKQSDTSYRQSLSYDMIALERQAIQINKEIQRIEGFLTTFEKSARQGGSQDILRKTYMKSLDQDIRKVFDKLAEYIGVTHRISNRLRYAADIRDVFAGSSYILPLDAYLQDTAVDNNAKNLVPIKQKLVDYSESLTRIVNSLNEERYGVVNTLYRAMSEPKPIAAAFLSKRQLFVLILSNVSILSLCLFIVLALGLVKKRKLMRVRHSEIYQS